MDTNCRSCAPQAGLKTRHLLLPDRGEMEAPPPHFSFVENPNGMNAFHPINGMPLPASRHHVPRSCLQHQPKRLNDSCLASVPTFVVDLDCLVGPYCGG